MIEPSDFLFRQCSRTLQRPSNSTPFNTGQPWALLLALLGAFVPQCWLAAQPGENPLLVAPTTPRTPEEQQKMFHLPPGFAIELVAAEPDVRKPMNLTFDATGKMFVTQSTEYPFPATGDATPRDLLLTFSDSNGDGVPDQRAVFAEGLNIPIGVAPVADAVLCYSIPNIYRFQGKKRQTAVSSFGFHDTHGMASSFTWWVDGWVYATHGFANTSHLQGSDGSRITMQSGNTFRFQPDGTRLEQYTWGQVNPFGLCFDPWGNLFSADCHTLPAYQLLRGAYYPSFGKPHDGLGFGPTILSHLHGSTGIAGIVYYDAEQFPAEYRDHLFVGNPVTGRINLDRLERHGSTYKAIERPDFVTCDDPWFRPVSIVLAPDGTLYIADFYNKIIGHYEVPLTHPGRDRERGRIWRVVYKGMDPQKPVAARKIPDFTQQSAEQLTALLGDRHLPVRVQATHQLVHRVGAASVPLVRPLVQDTNAPAWQRAHGAWVLERLGALGELLPSLVADPADPVRVHAVKILGERAKLQPHEVLLLVSRLQDQDAFARRAAADALGRHPLPQTIEPLLRAWEATPPEDTHLIHVLRMALRNQLRYQTSLEKEFARYQDNPTRLRRLADVALGAPTPAAAAFILAALESQKLPTNNLEAWLHHAIRYLSNAQLSKAYAYALQIAKNKPGQKRPALRAAFRASQERGSGIPRELVIAGENAVRQQWGKSDEANRRVGIEMARELRLVSLSEELANLVNDISLGGSRFLAMDVLAELDGNKAVPVFAALLRDSNNALESRQKVAELLGNHPAGRGELLTQARTAPEALATTLARGLTNTNEGAEDLLKMIAEGKTSPRLLLDPVVRQRLRDRRLPNLDKRLALLLKDLPSEDQVLARMLQERRTSYAAATTNLAEGEKLFTKHCAICHQIAGKGAKIGPQLDGVGWRGLDRLLEDTLAPNRNVDQAFRASVLALNDGRVVTGLQLRQDGQVLVLADNQGKEIRVAESEIADRRLSNLSPMPNDVALKLPATEFHHLLAYLLSQRQTPPAAPPKSP